MGNKKVIIYIITALLCITLAYLPINGKVLSLDYFFSQEHNEEDEDKAEADNKAETEENSEIEETENNYISASISNPTVRTPLLEEETVSCEEQSSSEPETIHQTEEDKKAEERDNKDKNDTSKPQNNNQQSQQPQQQTPQFVAPESIRNPVPTQNEDTSCVDKATLNTIRNIASSYISARCGARYSSDCENIAILRANGSGQNAGSLFSSFNNTVSWYEVSAYDYCLGFNSNQINEVVNKICDNFSNGYTDFNEYGCGVNVVQEDDCYRVKIVAVFCD